MDESRSRGWSPGTNEQAGSRVKQDAPRTYLPTWRYPARLAGSFRAERPLREAVADKLAHRFSPHALVTHVVLRRFVGPASKSRSDGRLDASDISAAL